jgi:hypothetical protein
VPGQAQSFAALAQLFPEGDLVAVLRDEDGVAAFRETLAGITTPDVEVVMSGPGGFSSTFRGVDGFVEGWRDWLEPFTSYRMELDPEPRISGDAVVLFARQVATPRGSPVAVTDDAASVAFLRDGRIHRIEFHLDREMALRAAGLDP